MNRAQPGEARREDSGGAAAHTDQQRIERLIDDHHPCVIIPTREEHHARWLIDANVESSLLPYWEWSVVTGLRAAMFEDAEALKGTENAAAAMCALAQRLDGRSVIVMHDLCNHLDDSAALRALRELIERCRATESTLFLIDHNESYPSIITAGATRFHPAPPDEDELTDLVKRTAKRMLKERGVKVRLTKRELAVIVRNLRGLSRRQAERIIIDLCTEDRTFDADDVNHALAYKRRHLHEDGLLDYVEAPVDLDQIGGMRALKKWLADRAGALEDDAAAYGLTPPRGVLLLGVQGAGKSLCAKAIATAWQRPLLRLDPGSLYDRYIGESERRLREALQQAELMSPIVLWIDEVEKGFASAAAQSNDGGLSQRMFGSLLTWMQDHEEPVFLVATANNIDALPPELLRKGRFDEIFFVDLPDESTRRIIFEIHLRKRKRDVEQFDLDALAEQSDGYSGAEIEQAIIAGLHAAYAAKRELTTGDIANALRNSPPLSVTMAEKVAALRRWAADRCASAD